MDKNNPENEARRPRTAEPPGMTELDIEGYGGDDVDSTPETNERQGLRGYGDRTDGDVNVRTDFGTGAASAAEKGGETEENTQKYLNEYEDTSANAGRGEYFGEFDDTGVGSDLTLDIMNTDERQRSLSGNIEPEDEG